MCVVCVGVCLCVVELLQNQQSELRNLVRKLGDDGKSKENELSQLDVAMKKLKVELDNRTEQLERYRYQIFLCFVEK